MNFTLKVKDSKERGARRSWTGRILINACWHVHGEFFDKLFEINSEVFISAMGKKITVEEFQLYVDGSYYDTYTNTTTSAIVNLEWLVPIAEGTYPTFNITILVWDGFDFTYDDHCFVTVDMTQPTISIVNPAFNYDIITEEGASISRTIKFIDFPALRSKIAPLCVPVLRTMVGELD